MLKDGLIQEIAVTERFFFKSIETLNSADALFKPQADMYSVCAHIHHVADSIEWFIDGAFKHADGFAMNFEELIAQSHQQTDFDGSVSYARKAFAYAIECIGQQSEEQLLSPLPDGPIMGGAPRLAVVSGIVDHTAHHRGALSVYARLLGKVAPMPYDA